MRRIGWDAARLARPQNRFGFAEGNLDLAIQNGEHFLEIVAMRRWAATGRDVHVN